MPRPVILTVDDDTDVLRAVERDLRTEYGKEYRVMRADSGASALELLDGLKRRGDPAALFLVDQRMPNMSGVELLDKASPMFPKAKKALLTAYADTDAAIRAINDVGIDYYLLKPWDPPSEKLYPVVNDLLDDWLSNFRPPFEGIRVVGNHWDPASHTVRDFLARNNVPYQWLDPEHNEEAKELVATASPIGLKFPALFFPDGAVMQNPSIREIAEKVGLHTTADRPFYDFVIVGAGPAGLAAAVYGASEGLRTIVVEKAAPGGQAGMSSRIENYLGFPNGLSGGDLARRAVTQARKFGVELLSAQEATSLSVNGPAKIVALSDGKEVAGRAVLIASGVSYRQLTAPGISELTGAGVYYGAALTEGESVRGEDVYIVGGANSAGQAAMYFSGFARSVNMLVRGESLSSSMSQYLIDQIHDTENINVWTRTEIAEAVGNGRLESLTLSRDGGEASETVPAIALFIFIGARPHTDWVGETIARDEHGYILAGPDHLREAQGGAKWLEERPPYMLETNVPGIFVAGDVRHTSVKRVASAVGEGSVSVMFVHQYLGST